RIPASFPKGTSNTILFTEHYAQCRDGRTNPPPGRIGPELKAMFWDAEQSRLRDYARFQVQPVYNPVPEGADPQHVCIWYRAQSPHPGGINAGLVDGSVRFVSGDVKEATWLWAMQPKSSDQPPEDW